MQLSLLIYFIFQKKPSFIREKLETWHQLPMNQWPPVLRHHIRPSRPNQFLRKWPIGSLRQKSTIALHHHLKWVRDWFWREDIEESCSNENYLGDVSEDVWIECKVVLGDVKMPLKQNITDESARVTWKWNNDIEKIFIELFTWLLFTFNVVFELNSFSDIITDMYLQMMLVFPLVARISLCTRISKGTGSMKTNICYRA